jgi:hypothetical protein
MYVHGERCYVHAHKAFDMDIWYVLYFGAKQNFRTRR